MPSPAEQALKRLSRLPANCVCANCGTTSKYGFSTVCIKYLTFVCNNCKAAHQAISHRCKSLTMSSWDQGEVLKLKTHGNDYARKVWLATAPEPGVGGRPKEGDDINVFKRFVVEVYENKRYYSEDGGTSSSQGAPTPGSKSHPTHQTRPQVSRVTPRTVAASPVRKTVAKPAPVPAPAPPPVDLLDFGAFDSAPTPAPSSAPSQPAPVMDNFANFSQATATSQSAAPVANFADFSQAPAPSQPVPNIPVDNFADFSQAPSPPTSKGTQSFDPFNINCQQGLTATPEATKVPSLAPPRASANAINDPFGSMNGISMANTNVMNEPFSQAPSTTNALNTPFDPFNNNNSNNTMQSSQQVMKPIMNMNVVQPVENSNNGNNAMSPGMMTNGNINNMMGGSNNMMMNNAFINNNGNMGLNHQQMMMVMQQSQQKQQSNQNFGMVGIQQQQNMMNFNGANMGQQAMNINVMHPKNNSISNHFVSNAVAGNTNEEKDPFSGLGF